MLSLRDVTIRRDGRAVLHDVDLDVAPGVVTVLRGRSGSGKSSLLQAIAGLLPHEGSIRLKGFEQPTSPEGLSKWRGAAIGIVDQGTELLPELTLHENVHLPLVLRRRKNPARANALLAQFGLSHLAGRHADKVSGGERQRAAIARGLVTGAKVLVVDEPTSALDEQNAQEVVAALQQAADAGAAVLVASHDDVFDGVGVHYEIKDGTIHHA